MKKLVGIVIAFLIFAGCVPRGIDNNAAPIARHPAIFPDYHSIVVPPNIAPLNFSIKEPGDRFYVVISGKSLPRIEIYSKSRNILIPLTKWRHLLDNNKGNIIDLDIYCRVNNSWQRYEQIHDTVAMDSIDNFIVYRKIDNCLHWNYLGIYQRDMHSFDEQVILHNRISNACFNCHQFRNNNAQEMILQVRSAILGTPMLLGQSKNGKCNLSAINTKTAYSHGKAGFTSWHPQGNFIAFSLNNYRMLMHSSALETRDVFDSASNIAIYDINKQEIFTDAYLASNDRIETSPEWSVDGRFLYYCSAPQLTADQYRDIRCDLMRIAFDPAARIFGKVDTVLTAAQAGGSIVQPRISPDGRYCFVSITDYGDFPIDITGSDLGLIDLFSSTFRKLSISSSQAEGWHCWSKNGRWMAFSTKSTNGKFSHIAFSHFDSLGVAHKPFVLPQKDPHFYASNTLLFNKPEFTTNRSVFTQRQFQALFDDTFEKKTDATTAATPQTRDRD